MLSVRTGRVGGLAGRGDNDGMTILVTGATGHVGRVVVDRLLEAGEPVRALTRRPDTAGLPAKAEVVAGGLTSADDLPGDVFAGVDRMYLFPMPESITGVMARAAGAGVRRVVTLSALAVEMNGGDNHLADRHLAVERAVEETGVEWTHLRPGPFAVNALAWAPSIRAEGVVRAAYGASHQAPIHEADIAEVAVAALLEDGHAGVAYALSGPESLTQTARVAAIGAAIGREIRFEEQAPEDARAQMRTYMPPPVADMMLEYMANGVGNPAPIFPAVQDVLGRPGRTFARWAADHAADFA